MKVEELKGLPVREKFQLLEALWEDLNDQLETVPISEDEKSLLDSRLQRLESNQTEIQDWDRVKDRIGKR